jgi:hypothetical protein
MPIKKCKYCKTRMSKVVWGMTSQEDHKSAPEFTEFRGCVITLPTESWRCNTCDAKIFSSHAPKSGLFINGEPNQLNTVAQSELLARGQSAGIGNRVTPPLQISKAQVKKLTL